MSVLLEAAEPELKHTSSAKAWRTARPVGLHLQLVQYIGANAQAYLIATLTYTVANSMRCSDQPCSHRSEVTMIYLASLLRDIVATATVYLWAKTMKSYNPPETTELAWSEVFNLLLRMLVVNCVVDTLEEYAVMHFVGFAAVPPSTNGSGYSTGLLSVVHFVAKLFAWEILFDLGFYAAHRIVHAYPWLYRLAHKEHHRHRYVTVLSAHLQNPIDVALNNFVPCVLACMLVPQFSQFEFQLMMAYKVLGELAGHSGSVTGESSFTILIQVPRLLGIELRAIDHNHHHTHNIGNFGKRFSLWDKLLGTFVTPTNLAWPHIPTVLYTPSPPFFMLWFGKESTAKSARTCSKEDPHSFATSLTISRQLPDETASELNSASKLKIGNYEVNTSNLQSSKSSLRARKANRPDCGSELSESDIGSIDL
ncbi:hypothetical protein SARC_08265 [Sphaeroforma arctica JP610]|uniref:Fatty acid hydroxylase domain-containing protein n=1 Tax=Sphaeroforma arctica JP610 TaxID=667725 RepID=A0A0L0FTS7_9EUKA|nr:hypothetical protein SARC_08265 [Sphaeroforma arctica JP610]KNC79343.1 hypothetical protein SARC_08265 [Sphaeroforma arctica JP610]|eukprot:XP_014153245.1 hypothetical protein SARC_08265 [Sphaeroforma arctica JP610]